MDHYADIRLSVREISEALGEQNAYYFFISRGRPHHDWRELLIHYIQHRPIPSNVIEFQTEDDETGPLFV